MEQQHQNLIKKNYSTLVREMKTSTVVRHLYDSNIITDEMKQQIETEKTDYDRNRKVLSILLRRGPKAFRGLRMALLKAGQTDISKLLTDSEDTMSEYEKKLAKARSLVVNTVERKYVENKSKSVPVIRQMPQDELYRINLDDFND